MDASNEDVSHEELNSQAIGSPRRNQTISTNLRPNKTMTIHELAQRYIGQLLNGCGDPTCTEVLCHTGRVNTTKIVVRKYTTRSARAIAVTMCSRSDPQSHLCSHYSPTANSSSLNDASRDPSSFVQRFCDTASIRQLGTSIESSPADVRNRDAGLENLNKSLKSLLNEHENENISSMRKLKSNAEVATILLSAIEWLLTREPSERVLFGDKILSRPMNDTSPHRKLIETSPTHSNHKKGRTEIPEPLHHEPYNQLLSMVARIISRRTELEIEVAQLVDRKAKTSWSNRGLLNLFSSLILDPKSGLTGKISVFMGWLRKLATETWKGKSTLERGTIPCGCLEIMEAFEGRKSQLPSDVPVPYFTIPLILSRVDPVQSAQDWLKFPSQGDAPTRHLFSWPFIFTPAQISNNFRMVNHLRMRQAHSNAEKVASLRRRSLSHHFETTSERVRHAEEHYLLLNVSRANILKDTFDQLWQRRTDELLRPLRVRLGEIDALEVGHDLGGVQIEFFNLVCREIFSEDAQMFAVDPGTGLSYLCPGSLQPLYMFEMFGILLALAIFNGIILPIDLNLAFYHQILDFSSESGPVGLDMDIARTSWPGIVTSLQKVLAEDVDGLEFVFPLEANGLRMTVLPPSTSRLTLQKNSRKALEICELTPVMHYQDLGHIPEHNTQENTRTPTTDIVSIGDSWPGWRLVQAAKEPDTVTRENKAIYVQQYISWLAYGSVAPQWDALVRGFYSHGIMSQHILSFFTASRLKDYVEGSKYLDISKLREITRYDGFYTESKYIECFWSIVTAWPQEKQKKLLKFVTASERVPTDGTGNLTFIIKKIAPGSPDHLPMSSTCFGTLQLPRYSNAEILAAKLDLALEYGSEGFGTG